MTPSDREHPLPLKLTHPLRNSAGILQNFSPEFRRNLVTEFRTAEFRIYGIPCVTEFRIFTDRGIRNSVLRNSVFRRYGISTEFRRNSVFRIMNAAKKKFRRIFLTE